MTPDFPTSKSAEGLYTTWSLWPQYSHWAQIINRAPLQSSTNHLYLYVEQKYISQSPGEPRPPTDFLVS